MEVERVPLAGLVESKLPDGSRILVDEQNETIVAMNATAGAAWEACSDPTTLSGVTETMRQSLDPGVETELAEEAIRQLREKNLVKTSGFAPQSTRRAFLGKLSAAAALPLVVSLTMTEQRAYAVQAVSAVQPPVEHLPYPYPSQTPTPPSTE